MDTSYKKILAETCEIDDISSLNSIVGEEEFKKLLTVLPKEAYMPGHRQDKLKVDAFDKSYIESGMFCANVHVHTLYSDGNSSVQTILDNALNFANENNLRKPFLLSITDHDTVDGAKEAVRLIAANPKKYKSVKFAVGLELSTVGTKFRYQTGTLDIHTLVYCINPFDEKLNNYITQKKNAKFELANRVLGELKVLLKDLTRYLNIDLTLEEAKKIHPMIVKGQDEVSHPLKKYIFARILFAYYVEKNKNVQSMLEKYGVSISDLSYEKPVFKYKSMFNNERYFYIYKEALELFLSDLIDGQENVELEQIPDYVIDLLLKAKNLCESYHPSLGLSLPQFTEFEDGLALLDSLDYGLISIAHPARLKLKNISDIELFYAEFFDKFKTCAPKRALAYEKYYQSYNSERHYSVLDTIDKCADKHNFLYTGGLDSHGNNVLSRCSYY